MKTAFPLYRSSFLCVIYSYIILFTTPSSAYITPGTTGQPFNLTFSCLNAKEPNPKLSFCDMVSWSAANAYVPKNYSHYFPKDPTGYEGNTISRYNIIS